MVRTETRAETLEGVPRYADRPAWGDSTLPTRKFTVFHVHQKTSLSTGSVQQMIQAANGLHSRGHRVIIVTRASARLHGHVSDLGIDNETLPFANLADLRTALGIRRLIRKHRPEVIHVHKGLAHWLSLVALIGDSGPSLIVNRGVSFPLTRFNRGKYRSARTDRIITVCEAVKKVIQRTGKVPSEKIEVVYAGTDVKRFDPRGIDPRGFRERARIPADAFVILQSGTRSWKGWREAVDAFAEVKMSVPESRLLIAGHDSDKRERRVRAYLEKKGLSDVTHLLGYRDDMEEVIGASDVTVDASWSGTGITGTVRESMAIGTPVVATDCGGNRELLTGPELGWLVPPRNHEQLVSALLEVASDPSRREAVARAAMERVRKSFSIDRRIDRLESIYEQCVEARLGAGALHRHGEPG